jgi:hypothetical protein
MGVCLGLMFDKKLSAADSFSKFTDGKDLVYAMDQLDELCKQHDVTTFSTFAPDYDSLAEKLPKGETLDEIWFEIDDGLRTISTLVKATAADKKWSKGLTKSEIGVVTDCLRELQRLLKTGKRKKARFSFLYY